MQNSIQVFVPRSWDDYELIDSGEGMKLERFGAYIIARPDPRAIWKRHAPAAVWLQAHATYERSSKDEGHWDITVPPAADWHVRYADLVFTLKPTSFKHVGVFPEQAVNWDWMSERIAGKPLSVLNLFAYTGGATLACAAGGATVTHVDSAKGAIEWAKANARASGLEKRPIRWIVDDALKFVQREARRGNRYDGIILDPPRFGRGAKGEVWKIQDNLPEMLEACKTILSATPSFILLNAYTADLSALVINHLLSDLTAGFGGTLTFGELALADTTTGRLLPNGLFARWCAT